MNVQVSSFQNEFRLKACLLVNKPIQEVFSFFSEAQNLERITPSFLNFKIISDLPIEMGEGRVIDYKLKLNGLPLSWKSLISHWEPYSSFTDEQLSGPYRYWIHKHLFEERGDSTVVKDIIRYQVYGGRLVSRIFVEKQVVEIFKFRQQKIADLMK